MYCRAKCNTGVLGIYLNLTNQSTKIASILGPKKTFVKKFNLVFNLDLTLVLKTKYKFSGVISTKCLLVVKLSLLVFITIIENYRYSWKSMSIFTSAFKTICLLDRKLLKTKRLDILITLWQGWFDWNILDPLCPSMDSSFFISF